MPAALRLKGVVENCGPDDARYLGWLLCRAGFAEGRLPTALLHRLKGPGIRHRVVEIVEEHVASAVVPEPPFRTEPPLAPITSLAMLRATCRRFKNCLDMYDDEVLAGSRFFYVWEGEEPAVLSIARVGALGWRVGELAGVRNREVSHATRLAIADALRGVPALFSDSLVAREAPRAVDRVIQPA